MLHTVNNNGSRFCILHTEKNANKMVKVDHFFSLYGYSVDDGSKYNFLVTS